MKKKLIICLTAIFISCNEKMYDESDVLEVSYEIIKDENLIYKKNFAKALAKVLFESKDARDFLKNESLKKINHDYDVIYQLVKNESLNNGTTLNQLISKYLSEEELKEIKQNLPTLTIFVPELPEDSFSAELWDTEKDIPSVGVRTHETNDVPIFEADGSETILDSDLIPGFPVVVVKENERIISTNSSNFKKNMKTFSSKSNEESSFAFLDGIFNNVDNIGSMSDRRPDSINISGPEKPEEYNILLEAYDAFPNGNGWHRDHIYYGLTQTNSKGPFNLKYKEHIVGFEMLGDGITALNKIADQTGDPNIRNEGRGMKGWTDGEFEFKVKVYVGNKSAFGTEFITYFRMKPNDIFEHVTEKIVGGGGRPSVTYRYIRTDTKRANLSTPLPLFEWDLDNYSSTIKIAIEEVDSQQTTVSTSTSSSDFATNFNFDPSFGEKVKVGLKFGSTAKETKTVSYQVTTTLGNDELGEVLVNFGDDIITNKDWLFFYKLRGSYYLPNLTTKYSTGWYRLYISPLKTN